MCGIRQRVKKDLQKKIVDQKGEGVDKATFDKALKEMLSLIADNIYPQWLEKQRKDNPTAPAADSKPVDAGATPQAKQQADHETATPSPTAAAPAH